MNNQEKARKIIFESGWIDDYYYIIKVMESCLRTTDVGKANLQLSKTFSWGFRQLENKREVLCDLYSKYTWYICNKMNNYRESLWDIRFKIQDKINYDSRRVI